MPDTRIVPHASRETRILLIPQEIEFKKCLAPRGAAWYDKEKGMSTTSKEIDIIEEPASQEIDIIEERLKNSPLHLLTQKKENYDSSRKSATADESSGKSNSNGAGH